VSTVLADTALRFGALAGLDFRERDWGVPSGAVSYAEDHKCLW
jgi:hypothetical protein